MSDVIRGHRFDRPGDELRDVSTVGVSGNRNNYALLVSLGDVDGVISSDNPLDVLNVGYEALKVANEAYAFNNDILKELKKMNVYLSIICNEEVKNEEIEV